MASAPPTIAATSTLAMVRTAGARGIETADLLAEAGVTLELLEDPDARLPGPTVLALWNALRERAADHALQLVAPTTLPFGAYHVIDYLVACSATVGEGVQQFARFFRLIADAVVLGIDRGADEHCLCLARADGGPVPPVYVDYVFAALVGRIRMRIRPALQVRRVELRQAEPPASAPYGDIFRAPVHFGAAADRLCFSAGEWDSPTDSADVALARVLEEHARILARRVPPADSGFTADVQKAIASAPLEGGSAEGYLTDPKVSIAEVAFLLGFSDQSSFNRAFRRWTGESPGRWRRERAAGGGRRRPGPGGRRYRLRLGPGGSRLAHAAVCRRPGRVSRFQSRSRGALAGNRLPRLPDLSTRGSQADSVHPMSGRQARP